MNADLVARYMLKMAADIELLIAQNTALAAENERLKKELEVRDKAPDSGETG